MLDLIVETVGARLRRFREERSFSQQDLARTAHLSAAYIGKLERGDVERPSYKALSNIAHALSMSTNELLGELVTSELEGPEVALARRAADSLMALKIDEPVAFLAALASLSAQDQETVADLVYARAARLRSSGIKPPRILGSAPEGDK